MRNLLANQGTPVAEGSSEIAERQQEGLSVSDLLRHLIATHFFEL
jgi:hypothetical protein